MLIALDTEHRSPGLCHRVASRTTRLMWGGQVVLLVLGLYACISVTGGYFRALEHMRGELLNFSIEATEFYCCSVNHVDPDGHVVELCDRKVLLECITTWYGNVEAFEQLVQTKVLNHQLIKTSSANHQLNIFFLATRKTTSEPLVSLLKPVTWRHEVPLPAWQPDRGLAVLAWIDREVDTSAGDELPRRVLPILVSWDSSWGSLNTGMVVQWWYTDCIMNMVDMWVTFHCKPDLLSYVRLLGTVAVGMGWLIFA